MREKRKKGVARPAAEKQPPVCVWSAGHLHKRDAGENAGSLKCDPGADILNNFPRNVWFDNSCSVHGTLPWAVFIGHLVVPSGSL